MIKLFDHDLPNWFFVDSHHKLVLFVRNDVLNYYHDVIKCNSSQRDFEGLFKMNRINLRSNVKTCLLFSMSTQGFRKFNTSYLSRLTISKGMSCCLFRSDQQDDSLDKFSTNKAKMEWLFSLGEPNQYPKLIGFHKLVFMSCSK